MITDVIRSLITQGADATTIKKQALTEGLMILRADGARKVIAGSTSSAEVFRVTAQEL